MSTIEELEANAPDAPRLNAWYQRKDRMTVPDRPRVTVWWPGAAPTARLQTIGHGPGQPDTLPDGEPVAYFTIGGVEFGGHLNDMEWLLDATREAVSIVRWQADCMTARAQATE